MNLMSRLAVAVQFLSYGTGFAVLNMVLALLCGFFMGAAYSGGR